MLKWYEKNGKNDDVVVSSRLRLARNFSDFHFSDKLEPEKALKMVNSVVGRFQADYPSEYNCIFMNNCDDTYKNALKEKRIISSYLANNKNGAVILSEDEGTGVLLNVEDHVRIQVLCNGMNMADCFKRANEIDDYIDANFDYAYDERYGYKTTYPTNIGTGLRASYTLHLPALTQSRRINQISTELSRFGVKFKTIYGAGDGGYGNIYQVASQRTLGQEEKEIIKDLDDIVLQIIRQEREQRKHYYENDRIQLEDEIYKSYGVLKYARKLSLKDAMLLISEMMLGISLGILTLEKGEKYNINKLLMEIQPAVINSRSKTALSVAEADEERAKYIRNEIPAIV